MLTALVTGANRGIGLGLIRSLLAQAEPPALLLATCRNPEAATELQNIASSNPALKVLKLDVSDPSSFEAFTKEVEDIVGENGLNVLINNAGVGPDKSSIEHLNPKDYINYFSTNVVGPVFITKALLPLIRKAARNSTSKMGFKKAVIINVSSLVGSLKDNGSGGMYGYRESKTALNMFTTNLKIELEKDGILVVPVHPGWVQTSMGGPNAPVSVDTSVAGMINILYTMDESKNGQFLNYNGTVLPW